VFTLRPIRNGGSAAARVVLFAAFPRTCFPDRALEATLDKWRITPLKVAQTGGASD